MMVNKSYAKGYRFQVRVRESLESQGYFILTSGKSRFPDFVALRNCDGPVLPGKFVGENKMNKYISKEEKEKADTIKLKTGLPFLVFYKEDHKIRWYEYDNNNSKK